MKRDAKNEATDASFLASRFIFKVIFLVGISCILSCFIRVGDNSEIIRISFQSNTLNFCCV